MIWKNRQLKIQLKVWNEKLKQSGFEDAEVELKNDRALKQRATNAYRQASPLEREARLDYYRILGHLSQNTEFTTELERNVMTLYANGSTICEIAGQINRHRQTIRHIIRRWQMRWGIRHWSPKQMNLKKK